MRDAETRTELCRLHHPGGIRAMAVSPDRSRVLTGGADGICRLWDVDKCAPACEPIRHGSGVWSVAISADSALALTAGFDGVAQLRDARTGASLRNITVTSRVQGVAFGADRRFAIGRGNKTALLFATDTESEPLVLRSLELRKHTVLIFRLYSFLHEISP